MKGVDKLSLMEEIGSEDELGIMSGSNKREVKVKKKITAP